MSRNGVRIQTLVVVSAVTTVVGFLAAVLVTRDGSLLQRPPWAAGVLLVVMGGLVLWLARPVRRHLRSGLRTSVDALRAARTVVLAQAAALTGAAAAGWYLGQLLSLVRDLSLVANQQRLVPFGLLLLASVLLAVCGMVAQAWCRIDHDDEDPPPGEDPALR
ncbi:DUF3180 domain-containing protein [Phycicoccus endophyticus]|uniref:DUF3180 domain-containing protein n=1 Tax=Phycicoccus endophyticus TaxID=1690220 RepID=UPI001409B3BA|nr:DUF3180 domain-containing protein [Phycicoccus endophyticus]NHI19988.1 DUF3180 domain-containing protein [Phycicoccus endophyticus]GGL42816.1 hypothetical protein GCM10012283_26770 [Phycicoccus endophyticus]